MKPYCLCYFTTNHSEVPSFSAGVREYISDGGAVDVFARVRSQLTSPVQIGEFARLAACSDIVIVRLMGERLLFLRSTRFLRLVRNERNPERECHC